MLEVARERTKAVGIDSVESIYICANCSFYGICNNLWGASTPAFNYNCDIDNASCYDFVDNNDNANNCNSGDDTNNNNRYGDNCDIGNDADDNGNNEYNYGADDNANYDYYTDDTAKCHYNYDADTDKSGQLVVDRRYYRGGYRHRIGYMVDNEAEIA